MLESLKDDPGEGSRAGTETEAGGEKGAGGERAGDLGRCNQDQGSERPRREAGAGEQARTGGGALESLSQGRKGTEWSHGLVPRPPKCC